MNYPNLSNEEKTTVATYEKIAREWSGLREKEFWSEEILRFHDLLPAGKILEVGAGSWRDAEHFLRLGYEYFGFDISPSFVKIASENHPRWTFHVGNVYDPNFTEEKDFDGFWGCAVFLHTPKHKIHGALDNCFKRLRKWAIGFISMQQGAGERMSPLTLPDNGTHERFFSYYSESGFREVLERHDLAVLDVVRNRFEPEKWMGFYFRYWK